MANLEANDQAWQQLFLRSEKLKKASSVNDLLSDKNVQELTDGIKNVLIQFLEKGDLHKGIKIYIDQELQNHWVQDMAKKKPTKNESIEQWCKEIFGDRKFGVIFNNLEAYDNEITEKMCSIVTPILKKAGLPLGGLSFLFFMGNYGFTPFGIHKESIGEEGFLFHLGPNEKKFYTWDIEKYNKIEHNSVVFHQVDEMLPTAQSYPLAPKSVMFIPHHIYHIANTAAFSLSVVMDYINPSRASLEQMIAKQIATTPKTKEQMTSYLSPVSLNDKKVDWNRLLCQDSWEGKFKRALKRHISRLKSNSGVLKPAIIEKGWSLPSPPFDLIGKMVFPIIEYIDANNETVIMARGTEIPVKSHPKLSSVLSILNKQERISFNDLKMHFEPHWDLIDIYNFVSRLGELNAIAISKNHSDKNL